jgi:DNA invertase Pin-like site-specific DNA recombinase
MPKAYSYIRFSTPEQTKGDSLRRQKDLSEKYAFEQGLELDTKLHLSDLGISAYDRTNVTKGALGEFLSLVRSQQIEPGSYLLVENLDRLSRANVLDAMGVFTEIVNAGITIVTLGDGTVYSRQVIENEPHKLLLTLLIMCRANEESAIKAKRLKAAWDQKFKNLSTKRLTARCPYWMKATNDANGFELIPERAEVVRKIIAMAKEGMGNSTIVHRLNKNNVPTFSPKKNSGWMPSYIQKLLKNPALYGEFNASGKLNAPIPGYFPAVITKEEWLLVDTIRRDRHTKGGVHKGPHLSNLFSGLLKCGHCGGPMNMGGYSKTKPYPKHKKYVACSNARRGFPCKHISWTYPDLENELIRFCKSVDFGSVLGRISSLSERANNAMKASLLLKDQIKQLLEKQGKLIDSIETDETPPKAIVERIKNNEVLIAELQVQEESMIADAQKWGAEAVEQSHQQNDIIEILDKLQTLQGTELHDLRLALSSRIKRVIDKIYMYPAGPWMTDANRAKLKEKMVEEGDLTEDEIHRYLLRFTEIKREERYMKIMFKNGMQLRLTQDHATPSVGEHNFEWYGEVPALWPISREDFLNDTNPRATIG